MVPTKLKSGGDASPPSPTDLRPCVPHNPETSTAAANAPTDLSISEGAVTLDEVQNAVKSLKNDRAAGICKITAELLKFGGECMLQWLQLIINCVWISEKIPDD